MKIVNEEISKIKSLMNLLTEDTSNPSEWVVGDFYIRRLNKTELNFDASLTDIEYLEATVTFRYKIFKITKL